MKAGAVWDADVLVLGAGMAGLTAARALAERGCKVVVLEARDCVGGRVRSKTVEGGQVIELGAEFIHGRAPELWALIEEAGVETTEREGTMLREEAPGKIADDSEDHSDLFAGLEQLVDYDGPDEAFADWIAKQEVSDEEREGMTNFVEGFNAADARKIGIRSLGAQQKAEDATEGDRAWHVRGGYQQLPEYLASRVKELGGEIRLHCEVVAMRWRAGEVEVETVCGVLRAPKCVVALPLGVVQRINDVGGIFMQPEPAAVRGSRRLCMGQVARFSLVFHSAWWLASKAADRSKLENMSFLFTDGEAPNVWWTQHPEHGPLPVLVGWAGGPRGEAIMSQSAGELGREACATLARVFGMDEDAVRAELVATYTHDWSADGFACGSYSYVPAGALEVPARMAEPVTDTLFFAGEHTDVTGHWGTVHAAMRSGMRAAEQVLGE